VKKSKAVMLVSAGLVAGLVLGTVGVSYAATGTVSSTGACGIGAQMGQSIRGAGARFVDIVADLTGLSVEEVQAQRAQGESIADIAEANGVSSDTVVEGALDARKAILDAKVADGTLTQEQADAAYAQMSGRLAERVTTDEVGAPNWAGQGRGRGAGMGSGACGSCTVTE